MSTNSSDRIVFNVAAAYARTVVGAGLALLSIRWVFHALGPADFGLYSIVGSLIVLVTFLNAVMAGSAARHFAYAIGVGDSRDVNRWFNTALSLHLAISLGLTLFGWPIGEFVIRDVLSIPAERLSSSLWVFRVSLLSAFVSMVAIPFVAMFNAKQQIAELSAWGTLQSVLSSCLAYSLRWTSADKLSIYAAGMVAILVVIQSAQLVRALVIFRECRVDLRLWFDWRRAKEITSFASWNLIGAIGMTLRDQGSALLLNVYFGPKVNASFGIANQVSAQANQLAAAVLGAISPEIASSEGRGDRKRMLDLSHRACKFGAVLVMLFAIPIMSEMDYILKVWLREPPAFAAAFCRLILLTFIIDRLSAGYMLAVNAYGRIAGYQLTIGVIVLCTLPLSWLLLKAGYAPTIVGVAFVATMLLSSFGRVLWVQKLFGVPVREWLTQVVIPSASVGFAGACAALAPRLLLGPSALRFAIVVVASLSASVIVGWSYSLDSHERAFVVAAGRNRFSRA